MSVRKKKDKSRDELLLEVEKLRMQLEEAEETLRAIRSGEVDALVVSTPQGNQVFTLKGAEKPYRILMEKMKEGAVTLAGYDTIFYCNQGFADMLKRPLEKMIGTGISQFVSPTDRPVFEKLLRRGKAGSSKGEVTFLAGDGTAVPIHLSINTILPDELSTVYLVATDITERKQAEEALQKAHDELEIKVQERTAELVTANEELHVEITEREAAEEALRESEQRWATTLASIGDAVIATDMEGRITFMNAEAEELTGCALTGASKRPVTDVFNIVNEYTRAEVENPVTRVLQEGIVIGLANHTILIKKDGTEVPIDDSGAPIKDGDGKTMGVVLIFRDITERKQAEQIEKEAKLYTESIVETVREPLIVLNADLSVKTVNQAFYNTFKVSSEEIAGKFIYDLGNRQWDVPKLRELLEEIIPKNSEVRDFEVDHEFQTIGKRTMLLNARRIYKESIGTQMILLAIEDITERKRAEEALQKAHDELEIRVRERTEELEQANVELEAEIEERERAEQATREAHKYAENIVETLRESLVVLDSELRVKMVNQTFYNTFKVTPEETEGKLIYELGNRQWDVSNLRELLNETISKNKQLYDFEVDSEFPNIGRKTMLLNARLLYQETSGTQLILLAIEDITERKRLEEQLLRSQRMESIGTLAGGIAHDLNNLLTPIMMSLQMLKQKYKDEQSQKLLTILENNSQRGASLIKQVMSFARGIEGERKPLQVAHIITEIEKVAKETFPRNIEIRNDIQKDLFTISGDATQLHQVIMNLCVNARDAMPYGGILGITASNFLVDESYVKMNAEAKAGPYVVISVSDTGTGIPPKVLGRIFEPFFTTKEFGKGTGLGLSTALAIVKSHGGFINVYSEVGKGTTFRVYLPVAKTEVQTEAQIEGEEQLKLIIGHGELILVAEDEGSIREITSSTLEVYGYKVLTADDGAAAVALYAQNKDKIKVVLMDMMMPVMDGEASIRAIRKINPEVKIIAASGLAEKEKLKNVTDNTNAFLPKPYTAERLLKTIHEVLNSK